MEVRPTLVVVRIPWEEHTGHGLACSCFSRAEPAVTLRGPERRRLPLTLHPSVWEKMVECIRAVLELIARGNENSRLDWG